MLHRWTSAALIGVAALLTPSAARSQTCSPPAGAPHDEGQWRTLPYLMPINPISATLLQDGRVLIVAGSENDASNNSVGAESYRIAIWDPTGGTQSSIIVENIEYDVFCSGTAVLFDGRPLVVGGTSDYSFTGEARSSIFDPDSSQFAQTPAMADGRWYATATALGDGRIMAFSGLKLNGATNNTVEIYDLRDAGAGWSAPATAPFTPPLYPRMFSLPSGKVFYTGHGASSSSNAWLFDPGPSTWTMSAARTVDRSYGTAVLLPLLPPTYKPVVMNFGGGNPATASTETIDLSVVSPTWKAATSMSSGRIQMNATILPSGEVLAEGGSQNNESPSMQGKRADLFDPSVTPMTMTSAGTASFSRLYHSVALLLPDATVVSMGSNPNERGRYEPAMEIYTPPYLFDANDELITTGRPAITSVAPASGTLGYGASFSVGYTSTSPIRSAVLVRPGSATHAIDMEQRLVGLCGPSPQPACGGSSGTLTLTAPPNGNTAPPGWYMLFLLDSAGVPSKARFVQLSPYATTPPTGVIHSPDTDVTIAAGDSVFFDTTTVAAEYSWVFPGGSPASSTAQTPGEVVFADPGEYVVSFTALDAAGNSDPNPPTRTITVLPWTPDFEIEVVPTSQTVVPGGSTTFTVMVSPQSGFTGTVTLSVGSESGFPTGITSGGFSPASLAGGSGVSTLTMNTTTSANPYALSLTVTGTSGTTRHTASTTLLVNLAAPAGITATPAANAVALSWPASVGANGYHVKRSTVAGGPYVALGCPTSTNYTDTGLTSGVTYHYVVSATSSTGANGGGESPDSIEAAAMPLLAAPLAPTALVATAGDRQVVLSWNAAQGAVSYKVKRGTTSGGPYVTVGTPLTTSYTDSGLTNGTTYYYVVSAVNSAGESPNSAQASAKPAVSPPSPPTGLKASSGKTKGSIKLQWTQSTSSGLTSNNIYRRTSSGVYPSTATATIAPATSYADSGLAGHTQYCYRITAVSASGESTQSNESCARTR